ncbi:ABC transporter permease [Streptomyces sp. 8K308]|uniref:ABC transporter permease n=1 Tax=Streptomyces sp. 8K308 TaxID=2530388 RepID=UPI001045FDA1|nr:ABC transporter permease [Streptomyces sp. 8K308]TDC07319.1 ABC transporter permease [Streptomyces sp. 8K308]
MLQLAIRSVRQRPGRFLGTLLAAFLGAGVSMAFNSLHDTAGAAGVDDVSAETLSLSGGVVGGYGTLLVFFAVASTLTVNVRQRESELALLRQTGATPAQVRRMVMGEAILVALLGAALAIGPAMLGGRALLTMFRETGQVAPGVDHVFGPIALSAGFGVTLLASAGAAFLAVRRATRAAPGARAPRARLRTTGGVLALLGGVGGVSATWAMDPAEPALMAAPAYGAILLSVGFATLSAGLLRTLLRWFGRPIAALTGAGGYLAVHNTRQRAASQAGVLMTLVLFTGITLATVCIQVIESDALDAAGITRSVEDKNLETLNLVVVGIIAAFCCVMLVNSLYAATSYRRQEFGRQRLAGATPRQVLTMVATESALLTAVGLFFGTVAGLAGAVAFSQVRAEATMPGEAITIWLGTAAIATVATLVTSVLTARGALRAPAIQAVAVAA